MSKATGVAVSGYSADTEILTRRRSWVTIDQLTRLDEVAARDNGRFTWQHPDAIVTRRYRGEMIWFRARVLDLLVAPGQPMRWTRYGGNRASERTGRAAHLGGMDAACLIATSTWDAPELGHKVFSSLSEARHGPASRKVFMTGDQYAAFMGMYIAEGCALQVRGKDWRVGIAQMPGGKGYEEYRDLLVRIFGREPGRSGHEWLIYSRALAQNLIPLGKAVNKRLPPDILGMSRRQLGIFWEHYWLGDGAWHYDRQTASTASPALAGELQEVIQKLGRSTSVIARRQQPNAMVTTSSLIYKLAVRTTGYPEYNHESVRYDGLITDVQVPSGTVYVRRNGHPVWAGA